MELELSKKEIEAALLEWVEKQFPGMFNEVHIRAQYGSLDNAVFSKKSEAPDPDAG
ncbi:MAG: hypothetical protein NUV75_02100 [Gallionella sp.]|nr:hypothetical protein [Gallionella sp.]